MPVLWQTLLVDMASELARAKEALVMTESQLDRRAVIGTRAPACGLCDGSGWVPGIAEPVGPLDESPCPECRPPSETGPVEDHWHECRYCREVGPCEIGAELAQHAKTYGEGREWSWACKVLSGP